jgi:hypothetical protein
MYKKLVKGILEALAVRFPTERSPVINATKISNLSNWPDPGSKDITGLPSMFCYLSLFGFVYNCSDVMLVLVLVISVFRLGCTNVN